MTWRAAVDLLVLATAIYLVLLWGREARALRAFVAILGMRAGALVARHLDLAITEWVFETASLVALVLLLVVFQAQLRRAFNSLDGVVRVLMHGGGAPPGQRLAARVGRDHAPGREARHVRSRRGGPRRGRRPTFLQSALGSDPRGAVPGACPGRPDGLEHERPARQGARVAGPATAEPRSPWA